MNVLVEVTYLPNAPTKKIMILRGVYNYSIQDEKESESDTEGSN